MKVLVAEDSQDFREYIVDILKENFDFDIDTVDNGKEMLTHTFKTKYNIIISDIEMPGMSGVDAVNKMKEAKTIEKSCQVIFLSGYIRKYVHEAAENGFLLLEKPVSAETLIRNVQISMAAFKKVK